MKKIKALITKIKSGLTLKTYQSPLLVTIVILLLLNLGVLIAGSIFGLIIDTTGYYFGGNFFKAFAQCLMWMITPNSITKYTIGEDEFGIMVLAAIVIGIEMILFSGAIVATLTTAIKGLVDSKSKAQGAIIMENHFVILNWNSKVADMVYNLLIKDYKGSIVILSVKDKNYIEGQVKAVISSAKDKKKRKIKLIVKEGNPLLHNNLEDISIEKASYICIMAREDLEDSSDDNILNSDLLSLKTVLALGNFSINKSCNIVVETEEDDVRRQIEGLSKNIRSLQDKTIIPVSFKRKIGQIIAQTLVDPSMAHVYMDLFSYSGCEFYSCDYDGTVDEYLKERNNSIPIIKYDKMFVLAEDDAVIRKVREKKELCVKELKTKDTSQTLRSALFVIGNNSKSEYIVQNLMRKEEIEESLAVQVFDKNDTDGLIEAILRAGSETIKRVLILSDDTVNADSYDANVFVSLIALSNAFPERENLSFITELLDSRNLQSVRDFNIENAIISNRMISLLLTNIALNKDSAKFFENLIMIDDTDGGECFDIRTSRAGDMLDGDMSFESRAQAVQSFYYAFEKRYMLLGRISGKEREYFAPNMDTEPLVLSPDDMLIYIAY